jgi:hypothetical protein
MAVTGIFALRCLANRRQRRSSAALAADGPQRRAGAPSEQGQPAQAGEDVTERYRRTTPVPPLAWGMTAPAIPEGE